MTRIILDIVDFFSENMEKIVKRDQNCIIEFSSLNIVAQFFKISTIVETLVTVLANHDL